MKHFGYYETIEQARAWKKAHHKDTIPGQFLEVASEIDKTIFGTDPITGNPTSLIDAASNTDPTVFASRYGVGDASGNDGIDDADFALQTAKGLKESDDQYIARMQNLAKSSTDTKTE